MNQQVDLTEVSSFSNGDERKEATGRVTITSGIGSTISLVIFPGGEDLLLSMAGEPQGSGDKGAGTVSCLFRDDSVMAKVHGMDPPFRHNDLA